MGASIELEIGPGREPGTWDVRVLRSAGAGAATSSFRLDVEAIIAQLPQLDSTVLASAVPSRRLLTAGETEIQAVGTELFSAVFTGDVEEAYRTSRAVARERGGSLQVRLRLVAPTLAALPWEALFDPEAGVYVCRKDPLIRQIPTTDVMEPLNLDPPLRVLAMVAAPSDLSPIDARAERSRLETALRPHIDQGRILLEWLEDVTWANVHAKLLSAPWHVLHFIGHGSYDTASDEGVLAFVGPDGTADQVDATALADLLDQAEPTPRLVVINSCMSGTAGAGDLYSGTAAALVNSGINAVAAMQFTISDPAALAFSQGFYTALAYGRRIDEAVVSGRIAILGLGRDTLEWVTPVLCLRGDETRLFVLPSPAEAGVPQPVDLPEPVPDAAPTPVPSVPTPIPPPPSPPGSPPARASDDVPAAASGAPSHGRRRMGVLAAVAAGAALVGVGGTVAVIAATSGGGAGGDGGGGETAITLPASFGVAGDTVWTPTGLDCAVGQRLLLTASGEVLVESFGGLAIPPDGNYRFSAINPQPQAPTAGLIGRIGEGGVPFVVGSRLAMECPADGELQLGVNVTDPAGNTGGFDVQVSDITVDPTIILDPLTPLTIEVPGDATEWIPTGINCLPGAAYQVWATGVISWGADPESTTVDADGRELYDEQGNDPSQNLLGLDWAEHGALVAAIDGLPPFARLGTDSSIDCYAANGRMGPLVLGVNDTDRTDNTGTFTVTLSRTDAPTG